MRWLAGSGMVTVDADAREQDSEQRRVKDILSEIAKPWPKKMLQGYFATLAIRIELGGTDLRSVRLAMRAAANLLNFCSLEEGALPTQKMIAQFWRSSPGQVASVTGFINYLNVHHNLQLTSRPDAGWLRKAKKDKAERELVDLLKERPREEHFEIRWVVKGLAYFHNVRRAKRIALAYRPRSYEGVAGFDVDHESETLWIPSADGYKRGTRVSS
ncbi:hypothetical protein CFII64_24104 [Pseudomonas sp. CFII64]|nr:hypothetical protein CFII64_24104 [Pseudomonas sp. CFII64]